MAACGPESMPPHAAVRVLLVNNKDQGHLEERRIECGLLIVSYR